ncbi:MAG: DNA cytosine methyltransferase [Deltaproteobacteria bacterium]|nr:DNA cytosine methyltransferase [Deltaproteobacteria bacterium]
MEVEESPYFWRGKPKVFEPIEPIQSSPMAVELFCGAGGMSLGFHLAGFNVILGVDIHSPSVESFRQNHPSAAAILGDIQLISQEMIFQILNGRHISLLVAGVPCQGFSLSNRKRFEKDKRNYLFLEFVKWARLLKPTAVILENVPGLKKTANGAFVRAIKDAIEEAGNYEVQARMLNAGHFGVPQLRERIFFVGLPKGIKFSWPEPTHGPRGRNRILTVRDAIGDLPPLQPGETKITYEKPPLCEYQRFLRQGAKCLLNHTAPNHPPSTTQKIARTHPGQPIYPKFTQRIRLSWDEPSPTQICGGIRPQFQLGHPDQPRGLSIRERARIQSFPDTFEFFGGIVQSRVQTGNAVPPILANALAMSLREVLERHHLC